MEETKLPEFLGFKPDPPDPDDFQFGVVAGPPPADMPTWEKGFDCEEKYGKLRDDSQGSSLGCVSFGITNDLEMTYIIDGKDIQFSQKFIYSQIRSGSGGASPRDAYKLLNQKGVCEDRYLPTYDNGKPLTEAQISQSGNITPEVLKNALQHKIDSYYSIPPNDWDTVRQAIYENGGCGGGYVGVNASMGHFIFFKGWGMKDGLRGLRYKDSYNPFDKWIVQKDNKYYLGNLNGSQVELFSLWTAIKDFPSKEMKDRIIVNNKEQYLKKNEKEIAHIPDESTLKLLIDWGWTNNTAPLEVSSLDGFNLLTELPSPAVITQIKNILPILNDALQTDTEAVAKQGWWQRLGLLRKFWGFLKSIGKK